MTPTAKIEHPVYTAIRAFLTTYIKFPVDSLADVCTLWIIGTHVYERFDSFGYLTITASTKRAGKSVLAELMAMCSHEGKGATSMTAAVIRRLVGKGATLFFDEAESLNSEAASAIREYLNVGYRAGQVVYLPDGAEDLIEFKAYSPKCFILIGDVNDTLRDRSINVELVRAKAPRIYRRSEAERSAAEIINGGGLHTEITGLVGESPDVYDMEEAFEGNEMMLGRETEVWSALFSLALIFAPNRIDALKRIASDLASMKQTTDSKRFSEIRKEAEKKAGDDAFSEQAMKDLASVLRAGESAIHTEIAIERMQAIATGPWRTYKGTGLTAVLLADLLKTFVQTKSIKIKGSVKRGYQRADILSAMKKLQHKPSEV